MITNLLLDRDGTLIYDRHYLSDPAGVELLPGVGEGLAGLAGRGMRFFLLSNQSGVGRGMFSEEAVRACNERLAELLEPYGVRFTDRLYCPHAPEEGCLCRKPGIGMWRELERRHALLPGESMMVGDKAEDMAFAAGASLARRALVLTGKGRETAERLALRALPGIRRFSSPATPSHPQFLLCGLHQLAEALGLPEGQGGVRL